VASPGQGGQEPAQLLADIGGYRHRHNISCTITSSTFRMSAVVSAAHYDPAPSGSPASAAPGHPELAHPGTRAGADDLLPPSRARVSAAVTPAPSS
jgi:hypothetical protein